MRESTRFIIVITLSILPIMAICQNREWTNTAGGVSVESPGDITVDHNGNIYMTGLFSSTADFDPGSGTSHLISKKGLDGFIVKYTQAGKLLWVKGIESKYYIRIYGIDVDPGGNVLIAGGFNDSLIFDRSWQEALNYFNPDFYKI